MPFVEMQPTLEREDRLAERFVQTETAAMPEHCRCRKIRDVSEGDAVQARQAIGNFVQSRAEDQGGNRWPCRRSFSQRCETVDRHCALNRLPRFRAPQLACCAAPTRLDRRTIPHPGRWNSTSCRAECRRQATESRW